MKDHSAFYRQVGEKIHARRGKNLSQEALASAVGLTRSSISNIEKGRQKLLLHTLVDISEALNVEVASLLPDRPAQAELVDADKIAELPANERSFIESAIGIKQPQKGNHARKEKENPGTGAEAPSRRQDQASPGPHLGHREGKRSTDRR